MPDLNSLPPSYSPASVSPSLRPRSTLFQTAPPTADSYLYLPGRNTPSPRSSPVSLAAAATANAADMSRRNSLTSNTRGSPRMGRGEHRRPHVAMTLNPNESTSPVTGDVSSSDYRMNSFTTGSPSSIGGSSVIATGDPHHHHRTASLGEIHQELEQEQEAQVNRLLQLIRTQQLQLEQTRQYQHDHSGRQQSSTATTSSVTAFTGAEGNSGSNTAVLDDSTPTSERSFSVPSTLPFPPATQAFPLSARRNSRPRPSSSGTSPALRPLPGHTSLDTGHSSHGSGEWPVSPLEMARRNSNRDESAYYHAETATLSRENQMLRLRVRELERQVSELNANVDAANVPPNAQMPETNLVVLSNAEGGGPAGARSHGGPVEVEK